MRRVSTLFTLGPQRRADGGEQRPLSAAAANAHKQWLIEEAPPADVICCVCVCVLTLRKPQTSNPGGKSRSFPTFDLLIFSLSLISLASLTVDLIGSDFWERFYCL